jgi:hypothetical protein
MDAETSGPRSALSWKLTAGICAALLVIFALLSYLAASTKNATYDEPLHALGGILHRVTGEFRLDAEDPPFFGFWASLPINTRSIRLDFTRDEWQRYIHGEQDYQWGYAMVTLYTDRSLNDGDAIIQRSRTMFTLVGIMLGALIAWFGWRLAGAWAAIVAVAFYALDPNFLAHSSLVKNDVMLAFLMLAMTVALWRFGRSGSLLALAGMAITTALAANVKFSAVLMGPIIFVTLLIRAMLPMPWTVAGRTLDRVWKRLIVVPAACAVVGFTTYAGIWICYGLRFAPAADHQTLLDTRAVTTLVKLNRVRHRLGPGKVFSAADADPEPLGLTVDALLFAERNRLLPQAWIYGFVYTYATTLSRTSYLMGQFSNNGFRSYFPLTMLWKTPTATLLAIPLVLLGAISILVARVAANVHSEVRPREGEMEQPPASSSDKALTYTAAPPRGASRWLAHAKSLSIATLHSTDWWSVACFVIPPAIYLFSAIGSNMNIGLRHILPVYPFIFLAIGIGFATLIDKWWQVGLAGLGVLLLGLLIETGVAYPDYIAFFNGPTKAWRDPIDLLSDSNLDWGQDLKQLGQWQRRHLDKPLYLNYFGIANPAFYGVSAYHMPGGWAFARDELRRTPGENEQCYLAISATNLQGVYYDPRMQQLYWQLYDIYPIRILGGSIYIYELPANGNMIKPTAKRTGRGPGAE